MFGISFSGKCTTGALIFCVFPLVFGCKQSNATDKKASPPPHANGDKKKSDSPGPGSSQSTATSKAPPSGGRMLLGDNILSAFAEVQDLAKRPSCDQGNDGLLVEVKSKDDLKKEEYLQLCRGGKWTPTPLYTATLPRGFGAVFLSKSKNEIVSIRTQRTIRGWSSVCIVPPGGVNAEQHSDIAVNGEFSMGNIPCPNGFPTVKFTATTQHENAVLQFEAEGGKGRFLELIEPEEPVSVGAASPSLPVNATKAPSGTTGAWCCLSHLGLLEFLDYPASTAAGYKKVCVESLEGSFEEKKCPRDRVKSGCMNKSNPPGTQISWTLNDSDSPFSFSQDCEDGQTAVIP